MSSEEIKVKVHSYGPGRPLSLVYFDPISGKKKAKSSGTTDWREAERLAGELQRELDAGRYAPPSRITWQQFRERYKAEHLASLKPKTVENIGYVLNQVEQHLDPDRLVKVNAAALSKLQSKLRDTGVKETTIASILRQVRAALGWAVSVGMLSAVPKVNMPKGARGRKMKGGAVIGEQFDRMLAAVPKVRPKDAAEWVRYLTALWLSGLRLQESITLSWEADSPFAVDLTGRRPLFRIKGTDQKSGNDQLLPMTPDFAEFLLKTPEAERTGLVFKLNASHTGTRLTPHAIGQVVVEIGEKAGAIVNAVDRKTASAHDLRRAFASRWAKRVAPAILQKLMRHASINTTMSYYVDLDVDEMADELWANHAPAGNIAALGNTFGNIGPESAKNEVSPANVSDCGA
jgi:integrase